jgi:glutamine amidotransferase
MCRLILAKGKFSSARILDAAIAMSCGRTADHEGPIQRHPNGGGATWRHGGRLAIHRDVRSIEDSAGASPVSDLTTDFLAVHVRHATLARNHGAEFTHPLEYAHVERSWYLLHNGFLPTIYQRLGKDRSEFDSAEYLEYLMRGASACGKHLLRQLVDDQASVVVIKDLLGFYDDDLDNAILWS